MVGKDRALPRKVKHDFHPYICEVGWQYSTHSGGIITPRIRRQNPYITLPNGPPPELMDPLKLRFNLNSGHSTPFPSSWFLCLLEVKDHGAAPNILMPRLGYSGRMILEKWWLCCYNVVTQGTGWHLLTDVQFNCLVIFEKGRMSYIIYKRDRNLLFFICPVVDPYFPKEKEFLLQKNRIIHHWFCEIHGYVNGNNVSCQGLHSKQIFPGFIHSEV